ncbi:MAG: DNA-protecting protein DprA [Bacteroidetes bacterium]|nr:MAG: DNA-protecting protein DprA [Bacteroidota bacterium]
MEDLLYKVALTRIPRVGSVTARTLVAYCGSARAVFEAHKKELLQIPGIGNQLLQYILSKEALREAEQELPLLERYDIQTFYFQDTSFPERLRRLDQAPVLLYYRGTTSLNHLRTVGIIGTRRPSPHGLAITERLIEELAPYQPLIISGMAYGIDITAHRAALRAGLPTVGVLGHGLRHLYPATHRLTAEEMLEQGGLLSEYPFFTGPDGRHFPMRNRIVAGLCDAIVVIESPRRGGSMITAKFANQYNRDVLAVPGRPSDTRSAGCNWLIKTHQAALLESGEDIAYLTGWQRDGNPVAQQMSLFEALSEEEKLVVDLLRQSDSMHIDRLSLESKLPTGLLLTILLDLECKGLLRSLPGKRYVLVK